MPTLEITADNVACSHGASVADLDENSMFYLAARGIDRKESRKLLLRGFVFDLLDNSVMVIYYFLLVVLFFWSFVVVIDFVVYRFPGFQLFYYIIIIIAVVLLYYYYCCCFSCFIILL